MSDNQANSTNISPSKFVTKITTAKALDQSISSFKVPLLSHPNENKSSLNIMETKTPDSKLTSDSKTSEALKSLTNSRKLIQETLDSSAKVLKRNQKTLSASEELEKKWQEFQDSFKQMTTQLISNIAANLHAEQRNLKQHGEQPEFSLEGLSFQETIYEHEPIKIPQAVKEIQKAKQIVVLTGAGVSVSSGIPTYRGNDGIWKMGSSNYKPQEIATWKMYSNKTKECWDYFAERYSMCRGAKPNISHQSIVQLESYCKRTNKSFTLVSQNIDGLHKRAGSMKTLEIHGNLKYIRCSNKECNKCNHLIERTRDKKIEGTIAKQVVPLCCECSSPMRPHVLFFDESYSEELYKIASVQKVMSVCDLLIVIGTMCNTSLPNRMIAGCGRKKIKVIDINPNANDNLTCARLMQLIYESDHALPKIIKCLNKKEIEI